MEPRELVVAPGGEACATISTLLDEAASFADILHVLVSNGPDLPVPLEATGGMPGRAGWMSTGGGRPGGGGGLPNRARCKGILGQEGRWVLGPLGGRWVRA